MRRRLRRDERGFTLPEVLVAMVMMLTVMFALYSIFDMSLRVFSFGNDKTEAVESARVGLSRMEREIRAAYPEDRAGGNSTLFYPDTDPDTITFRNDLNGDNVTDFSEEITYEISADGAMLLRNGDAVVENLDSINFDYQTAQGVSTTPDSADLVEIDLVVSVDGTSQTLNTDVSLRNA